jgi:hypothetical protein
MSTNRSSASVAPRLAPHAAMNAAAVVAALSLHVRGV